MKTDELAAALGLETVCSGEDASEVSGCYAGDLLSWVMGNATAGCAWITIMSNLNVAPVALLVEASCVILAENVSPDEALLNKAREHGLTLLRSPMSAYELCWRAHEALL